MPQKLVIVGVGSFLVGGGLGYLVAKKRLEAKYDALAMEEITALREQYRLLRKDSDVLPEHLKEVVEGWDEGVKEEAEDIVAEEEYDASSEEPENVFTNVAMLFEEVQKVRARQDLSKPHVITVEEFLENETSFEQISLVYYDEDNVLADDSDSLINDVNACIGEENLSHFGVGSNDPDAVYIRNPITKTDFEVTREETSYSESVLGIGLSTDNTSLNSFKNEDDD